jgi:acylphosphatase
MQTEQLILSGSEFAANLFSIYNIIAYKYLTKITKFRADFIMRSNKSYIYRVDGRVQGVGFRYFTYHLALKLSLGGYVRNTHDGKVEGAVSGPQAELDLFFEGIQKGPALARVTNLVIEDTKMQLPKTFEIRH